MLSFILGNVFQCRLQVTRGRQRSFKVRPSYSMIRNFSTVKNDSIAVKNLQFRKESLTLSLSKALAVEAAKAWSSLSLKLRLGWLEAAVKQHRSWSFDTSLAFSVFGEPNIGRLYRFL